MRMHVLFFQLILFREKYSTSAGYSTIYYSRAYELNLYKGVVSYSPPPSQ